MRVAIGTDHAGFALKAAVVAAVRDLGHEPVDFGTWDTTTVDYPDFVGPAAKAVASGDCQRAIVLGGSGTGEAIVANKVPGVRCVEATDPVVAGLGRRHNDCNALAMGGRIVGVAVARACVEAFLTTDFEGGRHVPRLAKVAALEEDARTGSR
jgi:ribose 5-phosphate isomerase B